MLRVRGVVTACHRGEDTRPILVMYGRTHTDVSKGFAPQKIRCFCAFRGDGNVQSEMTSAGTMICNRTALRRRLLYD